MVKRRRHAVIRPVIRRAVTLIEVLIVIAILLAIGGLVVFNVMPAKDQADIDLTKEQINRFEQALEKFKLDVGRYPTEDEGLAVLWDKELLVEDEDRAKWRQKYLTEKIEEDTWGNEWIYNSPSLLRGDEDDQEEASYDIISMGPDGEQDTEDDITNHANPTDAEDDGGFVD